MCCAGGDGKAVTFVDDSYVYAEDLEDEVENSILMDHAAVAPTQPAAMHSDVGR